MDTTFVSAVFPTQVIKLSDTKETIVQGGRDKFSFLKKAFEGINQIGVIGWGSQGPAQAKNLRDSLEGTDIIVKVGLRSGRKSVIDADEAGFTEENGTLGDMWDVIAESDMVILLISDAAQVENYREILKKMKPGATLGLSHGFLLGHMESVGHVFRPDINVIGVCPKGMGPSVRRLYVQGKEVNGAGINCSFAVQQDIDDKATDRALGWAIALGAPYVFKTTLGDEFRSDIFGERGVLLGGVHGMVEALNRSYIEKGSSKIEAFLDSVEQVTGKLSSIISGSGILGVYRALQGAEKDIFAKAFCSAYHPYYVLLREIYDEVASGNEIRSVVMAGPRLEEFGWSSIENTPMWKAGNSVRSMRDGKVSDYEDVSIEPTTAGVYCAMMMAQINVLLENGHCFSEVCNETVIEAVDSLNPYMHFNGVAFMVDNCSTTARLGTRKWGPRFDHITMQQIIPGLSDNQGYDEIFFENMLEHPIHGALATCAELRPSVNISLS